jgi:hypothetical protein
VTAVVFNPTAFRTRYPEFAAVTDPVLQSYFTEACLYLSNSDNSAVQDIARRTLYLNMIVAHIAALAARGAGIVGRTSQASEGSVSVSTEYITPGSGAWFAQTQYGAAFWQATTSLRGFRYRARPTVF